MCTVCQCVHTFCCVRGGPPSRLYPLQSTLHPPPCVSYLPRPLLAVTEHAEMLRLIDELLPLNLALMIQLEEIEELLDRVR